MKFLIIEDDRDIAELVEYHLAQLGAKSKICHNGAEGLALARRGEFDLLILDLMLPDIGGIDICRTLRADARTGSLPIIMLTAKGEEIDKVVGFEMGADDYVTKPFSPRELVLRVKAVLKRTSGQRNEPDVQIATFGALRVDPSKHKAWVGKRELNLTALEFKLLQHLMKNMGRVSSRESLLDRVWGFDVALTTRTVDTHIKRLREKLGSAGEYIETVRGVGYRFKENISK